MKKNLLLMAALVVSASMSAQVLTRVATPVNNQKLSAAQMVGTSIAAPVKVEAKKPAKAMALNDIFGARLQVEVAYDQSISTAQAISFEAADIQDQEGNTYNVKINDFWKTGSVLYGYYDAAAGTLTIPQQKIAEDATQVGYRENYSSFDFLGINKDDYVSMGDIVFVENNGNFELADTLAGYYIYAPEYEYVDEETGETVVGAGWTYAYDVRMVQYNGLMGFTTTAKEFQTEQPREGSSWAHGEMQINYEDLEFSYIINGFLGEGCVSIDLYEDGTCEMAMGQELSPDPYPDDCGRMTLWADKLDQEQGTISLDKSIEYIEGEYWRNVGEVDGDVVRFFGVDDEGYYTYNDYIMPCAVDDTGAGYWMGGHFCALEFVLYHGEASGIEDNHITLEQKLKSSKTYNMMGQRVNSATAKGLMVRNGKKYIKK